MAAARPADRPLRVAMIGQKGYPPVHGGIERHVAELASRLVVRGIDVDLYSRPHYSDADGPTAVPGLAVRRLPSIPTKHLDAISHTVVASFDALRRGYDVVHYHALGPGLLAALPRWFSGARTVTTVHGLDWQREKWGWLASRVLKMGEAASARLPDSTVVVSEALRDHYRSRYGHETVCIPNGITLEEPTPFDGLERLGVRPGYVVFVGRLVPEKGCHTLLDAYAALPAETRARHQLVIAGGAGFTDRYERELRARAGADILFTGFVHGATLSALWSNAALAVLPSTLEGLSIALLEGMSHGLACLASDIPPNREAGGDAVAFAPPSDPDALARAMGEMLADVELRRRLGDAARARVAEHYSWETAADATAAVYEELVRL